MKPRPRELEREKVALLRDVCGLLRESADYQKEVIVLKRAKLDIMARQLALEEETGGKKAWDHQTVIKRIGDGFGEHIPEDVR
ncbi:unnamed protein product [Boreogadus saida]